MAYKVFRVHEYDDLRVYTSTHAKGWLKREYQPAEGREEHGQGLFLFHDLESALYFARVNELWCIWEVEVIGDEYYPPADLILNDATLVERVATLQRYWQEWYAAVRDESAEEAEYFNTNMFGKAWAPGGTIICDGFRYVKPYNPQEEHDVGHQ